MKFFYSFSSAIILLPCLVLSDLSYQSKKQVVRHDSGCGFQITSSGTFACPAGQLPDGQIRLNGTEETATFYIDSKGGITDSHGFGCIVTDPPTTQFQCDQGKAPTPGFSIDSSNNLLYHGSPGFYACPVTDTTYNAYVKPDFGQTKCFAIALKASGCGGPAAPTCPEPSTIWQTQTVTEISTKTLTVTTTAMAWCNSTSVTPISSSEISPVCHHCTKTSVPSTIKV